MNIALTHPVRVLREDLQRLCRLPHVPEFNLAVVAASNEVVRLVWVIVQIPNGLQLR
jgi:hypothetical protein